MAATESTTPADRGSKRGNGRAGPYLQRSLVLVAAAFLVYLAWPRLHASLRYLPVDTAINRYYDTADVPALQLEGLQQRAADAIGIHPHHRYWDGLSLLHYLQATDTDNPLHKRREAFEESITAAEASLRRAPAQPRAWLRIAQARSWLRYPPEQVIEALKMAIYTGRVEPSMFLTRLALGLAYMPRMDGEALAMLRDQVLLAWQLQPRLLANALKNGDLRLDPLVQLLTGAHDTVLEDIREAAGGAAR